MAKYETEFLALLRKEPGSDWGVEFPDVPGCVTAGETVAEARHMAIEALQFHLDGMEEDGLALPTPATSEDSVDLTKFAQNETLIVTRVPTELPSRTVRVNVSIQDRTLARLDAAAKEAGTTRSGMITRLVDQA